MKLVLKNVRAAFLNAFEAKAFEGGGGDPSFGGSFLVPPTHPQVKEIDAAIEAVAKEKWGAKATETLKQLRAKDKVCFRNGDDKASYDGFDGNMYVAASSKTRPLVIDRDKTPLVQSDGRPYSGCYVVASLEIWAQDNQYGKRVNATLKGVQFYADGDAFSGSTPASPDDFDDLSTGADADALA
jgi:hypothetical protein